MKVKELIKKLEKFNQEANVGISDEFGTLDCEPKPHESMWEYQDGSFKDVLLW